MSANGNTDSRGTVAELRALLDKATPGPWEATPTGNVHARETVAACWERMGGHDTVVTDAALIAALRNAAPDLLRVVEAVASMVERDDLHYCHFCVSTKEHRPDCAWALAFRLAGGAP